MHHVPDVFHLWLHLVNKFYELVEDVCDGMRGSYSKDFAKAMVDGGMSQMYVKGFQIPTKTTEKLTEDQQG